MGGTMTEKGLEDMRWRLEAQQAAAGDPYRMLRQAGALQGGGALGLEQASTAPPRRTLGLERKRQAELLAQLGGGLEALEMDLAPVLAQRVLAPVPGDQCCSAGGAVDTEAVARAVEVSESIEGLIAHVESIRRRLAL